MLNWRGGSISIVMALVAGCSSGKVRKEHIVPVPVVLANSMCAETGKVQLSMGEAGERMICEMQMPVGTHVARCTCWDEGMIAEVREETQVQKIQTEFGINSCNTPGAFACDDGLVGRTSTGGRR